MDVAIVGGGLVGVSTALQLVRRGVGVAVHERGDTLGAGQSGHNSNVIHSGAFYVPGSLKARLAVRGREMLEDFIRANALPHRTLGKLVVEQRDEGERFDELARRAAANGVDAEVLGSASEMEPFAVEGRALWLPEVAVTDFTAVLEALVDEVELAGGEVFRGSRAVFDDGRLIANDRESRSRHVVVAAGLGFNGLCRDTEWRIVGFHGAYRALVSPRVEHLVYAVPAPRYPFLGVHLTPGVDGSVTVGPNATMHAPIPPGRSALLAARNWRAGLPEIGTRFSEKQMQRNARRYVPDAVVGKEIVKAGVRAQAVDRWGRYADDFVIVSRPGATFIANAPSPAATACLAIGEHIANLVMGELRR